MRGRTDRFCPVSQAQPDGDGGQVLGRPGRRKPQAPQLYVQAVTVPGGREGFVPWASAVACAYMASASLGSGRCAISMSGTSSEKFAQASGSGRLTHSQSIVIASLPSRSIIAAFTG